MSVMDKKVFHLILMGIIFLDLKASASFGGYSLDDLNTDEETQQFVRNQNGIYHEQQHDEFFSPKIEQQLSAPIVGNIQRNDLQLDKEALESSPFELAQTLGTARPIEDPEQSYAISNQQIPRQTDFGPPMKAEEPRGSQSQELNGTSFSSLSSTGSVLSSNLSITGDQMASKVVPDKGKYEQEGKDQDGQSRRLNKKRRLKTQATRVHTHDNVDPNSQHQTRPGPTMISYTSVSPRENLLDPNNNGQHFLGRESGHERRVLMPIPTGEKRLMLHAYQLSRDRTGRETEEKRDNSSRIDQLGAVPKPSAAISGQSNEMFDNNLQASGPVQWSYNQSETAHYVGTSEASRGETQQPAKGPYDLEQFSESLLEQQKHSVAMKSAKESQETLVAATTTTTTTSKTNKQQQGDENRPGEPDEQDEELESEGGSSGAAASGGSLEQGNTIETGPTGAAPSRPLGTAQKGGLTIGNSSQHLEQSATKNHQREQDTSGGLQMSTRLPTNELLVGPFRSEAEAPATITLAGVVYQKSGASQAALIQGRPMEQPKGSGGAQVEEPFLWRPVASGSNIVLGTTNTQNQQVQSANRWQFHQPPFGSGHQQQNSLEQHQQQPLMDGGSSSSGKFSAPEPGPIIEQHSVLDLLSQLVATATGSASSSSSVMPSSVAPISSEVPASELLNSDGSRQPTTVYVGRLPAVLAPAVQLASSQAASSDSLSFQSSQPGQTASELQQQLLFASGSNKHQSKSAPIVIVQKDVKPVKYHLLRAYLKLRRLLRPFEATYIFPTGQQNSLMAAGSNHHTITTHPGQGLLDRAGETAGDRLMSRARRAWSKFSPPVG